MNYNKQTHGRIALNCYLEEDTDFTRRIINLINVYNCNLITESLFNKHIRGIQREINEREVITQ